LQYSAALLWKVLTALSAFGSTIQLQCTDPWRSQKNTDQTGSNRLNNFIEQIQIQIR
jgi:hypothetical protein